VIRLLGVVAVAIGYAGLQLGYPAEACWFWLAGGAVIVVMGPPRRWDPIGRTLFVALAAIEAWIVLALMAGVR